MTLLELLQGIEVAKAPAGDQSKIDALNATINWQAGIIHQISEALKAGDRTAAQLPERAKFVMEQAGL